MIVDFRLNYTLNIKLSQLYDFDVKYWLNQRLLRRAFK